MRRRDQHTRAGFTLIEVLLVAGILALLAALAIPQLFGQAEKAKIDIARTYVGRNGPIAKALNSYKWDIGKYPDTDEGLEDLLAAKQGHSDERYDGPYLDTDELKDPWGNPFEYRSPGEVREEAYDLWSRGPDRNDDGGRAGSDDIKNWIEK